MRAHLAEPLTVERLADRAAMSPRHFARAFVQQTGTTPAKAVERAYRTAQKRILRHDNRPIKEKNLKLFRFVTERLEPTGLFEDGEPRFPPGEEGMTEDESIKHGAFEKKPTGRELVREWDALPWVQKNQWTYGEDTGRFLRDYKHTKLRIAYSALPLR